MSDKDRYDAAAHAVQTGIATLLGLDPKLASPKNLRTGLDCGKADMEGLVTLLIAKGVFTEAEYGAAMADAMEREKARWEADMSTKLGRKVSLG